MTMDDSATQRRLDALLLESLELPCETGDEGPMADWLAHRCDSDVHRVGQSVVAGDLTDARPMLLLVAHLDVVPPTEEDRHPRVDGPRIVGRGTSDMKSGLAVALDVFADEGLRSGSWNIVIVGYAGEEGPLDGNELPSVLAALPQLREAALAVVLEPTDLEVQLGCLGGLHAHLRVGGRSAHSARPWHGDNAVTKAAGLLAELHALEPQTVPVDGLEYRDVYSVTQAWTSNARNVIPDAFTINLNYRFSPAWSMEEAEAQLQTVVAGRAEIDIVDRAPPAPPRRRDPAVARFVASAAARVTPKQAWTDVAQFAAAGVPALNYGPGLVSQAHQRGEYVPRVNMVLARRALAAFVDR